VQKVDPALYRSLPKHFNPLPKAIKPLELIQSIQLALENNSQSLRYLDRLIQSVPYTNEKKHLLQAWRSLINSHHSLYLNYYGDVGSINTIPLYKVLAPEALAAEIFKDKIVLVGYSTDIEPDKNQGFYTIFSKNSENNISPVEILATAVANLIDRSWIKPLPLYYQFLMIMLWGMLLSGIFRIFSYKISISIGAFLSLTYGAVAYITFRNTQIWIPLFTVILQTGYVSLVESIIHLRTIHKVFTRYLPNNVFNKNTQHPDAMDSYGELMHGVCMATDAGQYTTLSESMNPMTLNTLMNKYYGVMFPAVKAHNGLISDVIGDAMLALWAKPIAEPQLRMNACYAALKINNAVQQFNQSPLYQLPTRLGLHYGEMRLGNVGAPDHYEYRAVGDIVNTSTRIEGLNKILGTRILVSDTVLEGLSGLVSREIGVFLLKGKTQSITIYELIDKGNQADPKIAPLLHAFAKALALFQSYQWTKAHKAFVNINKYYPNDGPTVFYMHYLQKYQNVQQERSSFSDKPLIDISSISDAWLYV